MWRGVLKRRGEGGVADRGMSDFGLGALHCPSRRGDPSDPKFLLESPCAHTHRRRHSRSTEEDDGDGGRDLSTKIASWTIPERVVYEVERPR